MSNGICTKIWILFILQQTYLLSTYHHNYRHPSDIMLFPSQFYEFFVVNRNPDQPRIEMFKHELSVIIIQIGILSKKRDDYKWERCYIVVFLMDCESFYSSNYFFLDFRNISSYVYYKFLICNSSFLHRTYVMQI